MIKDTMYKFDYRLPRFPIQIPVLYSLDGSPSASALCTEISVDGITVQIETALKVDGTGSVSFNFQGGNLCLDVRVIHVGETHAGMSFQYKSDEEREAVAQLLESIATRNRIGKPVLVL